MKLADISKLGVANLFRQRYDNDIGGRFVAPTMRLYFANVTSITGQPFCEVAFHRQGYGAALDAAHADKDVWGKLPPAERANLLNNIADRTEQNLSTLETAETIDNGKPVRET